MGVIKAIFVLIRAFLVSRLSLAAEILALQQQVATYKHTDSEIVLPVLPRGAAALVT